MENNGSKDVSTFEGDFENDGFGVYTYPKEAEADYYEGHWKDEKKLGKEKYVMTDGSTIEGDFENDKFNGFGV